MKWIILYVEHNKAKLWISDNAAKAVDFLMYLRRNRMDRSIMYGADEIHWEADCGDC